MEWKKKNIKEIEEIGREERSLPRQKSRFEKGQFLFFSFFHFLEKHTHTLELG